MSGDFLGRQDVCCVGRSDGFGSLGWMKNGCFAHLCTSLHCEDGGKMEGMEMNGTEGLGDRLEFDPSAAARAALLGLCGERRPSELLGVRF